MKKRRRSKTITGPQQQRIVRLRKQGKTFAEIASIMGLSTAATHQAFIRAGGVSRNYCVVDVAELNAAHLAFYVPTEKLEERNERLIGYMMRDLTGIIMGDPPRGFSALDMRAI